MIVHERPPRNWVVVASAEHAPVGFMQVGHGKRVPLMRIAPGDRIAYYAPATSLGGKDKLQSFVSIGVVQPGEPYSFDMGGGFVPWRRNVKYVPSQEAPIAPLLEHFNFVEDRKHWGAKFRFGLFEVDHHELRLIAPAMGADINAIASWKRPQRPFEIQPCDAPTVCSRSSS